MRGSRSGNASCLDPRFHGDNGQTYAQAVTNAQQIIEAWLETARELGRPIPQPKGRLMYA